MNKYLINAFGILMLFFASNYVNKIYCMNQDWNHDPNYLYLDQQLWQSWADEQADERAYEDTQKNLARVPKLKKQTGANVLKNIIIVTSGLFLGHLALGFKPQLIDIIPNCLAGFSIGYSMSSKNKNNYSLSTSLNLPAASAGLWISYTLLRSNNNLYDHWLRSLLTK